METSTFCYKFEGLGIISDTGTMSKKIQKNTPETRELGGDRLRPAAGAPGPPGRRGVREQGTPTPHGSVG